MHSNENISEKNYVNLARKIEMLTSCHHTTSCILHVALLLMHISKKAILCKWNGYGINIYLCKSG